jgi:hypothetical protein
MLNFWQVCAAIFGSLLVIVILYVTCLQAGLRRDAKEADPALSDSLLASGATGAQEPSPLSPALPDEP